MFVKERDEIKNELDMLRVSLDILTDIQMKFWLYWLIDFVYYLINKFKIPYNFIILNFKFKEIPNLILNFI